MHWVTGDGRGGDGHQRIHIAQLQIHRGDTRSREFATHNRTSAMGTRDSGGLLRHMSHHVTAVHVLLVHLAAQMYPTQAAQMHPHARITPQLRRIPHRHHTSWNWRNSRPIIWPSTTEARCCICMIWSANRQRSSDPWNHN